MDLGAETRLQAIPLRELVQVARRLIQADPQALLCQSPDCLRCQAVRGDKEPGM
jgi:hypothetical protein